MGNISFYSITFRLFKLPRGALEPQCEDYGQFVQYKVTTNGERACIPSLPCSSAPWSSR